MKCSILSGDTFGRPRERRRFIRKPDSFQPYSPNEAERDKALSLARRAVERDAGFAQAHALIAEIHTFAGFWNHGLSEDVLAQARQAAQEALKIDPELSYPHAVLGARDGGPRLEVGRRVSTGCPGD